MLAARSHPDPKGSGVRNLSIRIFCSSKAAATETKARIVIYVTEVEGARTTLEQKRRAPGAIRTPDPMLRSRSNRNSPLLEISENSFLENIGTFKDLKAFEIIKQKQKALRFV